MKYYVVITVGALLISLCGCKSGYAPRHFYKAAGPIAEMELKKGADTSMLGRRPKHSYSHELLAFGAEGLFVVANEKLVHVDYNAITSYKHRGKRRWFSKKDNAISIKTGIANMHKGGMTYLVRYPQGISPVLLEALLEAYDQDSLVSISVNNSATESAS